MSSGLCGVGVCMQGRGRPGVSSLPNTWACTLCAGRPLPSYNSWWSYNSWCAVTGGMEKLLSMAGASVLMSLSAAAAAGIAGRSTPSAEWWHFTWATVFWIHTAMVRLEEVGKGTIKVSPVTDPSRVLPAPWYLLSAVICRAATPHALHLHIPWKLDFIGWAAIMTVLLQNPSFHLAKCILHFLTAKTAKKAWGSPLCSQPQVQGSLQNWVLICLVYWVTKSPAPKVPRCHPCIQVTLDMC